MPGRDAGSSSEEPPTPPRDFSADSYDPAPNRASQAPAARKTWRASFTMEEDGTVIKKDLDTGVITKLKKEDITYETEYVEMFSYNLTNHLSSVHLN
jgi:hypothetical protein